MHLVSNSITVVLIGDWNKQYIQPEWVSKNIYENSEIEILVDVIGADICIYYRNDDVIIKPTQEKIIFTASNATKTNLTYMAKCISNFFTKAVNAIFKSYGFNAEYSDTEDLRFASVVDMLSDTRAIIELGYEVSSTTITRTLIEKDKHINMTCSMNSGKTTIRFNEHHADADIKKPEINCDKLLNFISQTKDIIIGLGYEDEDDEDEDYM